MNNGSCRSWLLVSMAKVGDVGRAVHCGADVVVFDLVEFVAEEDRPAAREKVRSAVAAVAASGTTVFVQTTSTTCEADLQACVWPGLNGIVLSRVDSAQQMQDVNNLLSSLEKERGLAEGAINIVAALETARGNQDAYEIITSSKRVSGVTLGRADLVMDLRPEPSGEIHLMPYLMQRLIIISRALGVTPLGAWWRAPDRGLLSTAENTLQAAWRGRAAGFKGALCLRVEQIEALNKAYA